MAELETIVRLQLPITVIVANDSALSLIEIKQGADHGGPDAVRYKPTNFAIIAEGMGMAADVVHDRDQLAAALANGFDGPRLLDTRINPDQYPHLIKVTRG
jgi:acetolactate synthase-1/2/3 large subunit